jgi:probable O-glycosylation ligase (exosortase A-associated)
MRDIAVTLVILGSLPFCVRWPHVGVLMWTWLAFMNPHRLTWGFAYNMQFAMFVALATLVGLLFSKEPKKIPWTAESVLLLAFIVWMFVTTCFATYPALAWPQLEKVAKIQLMIFVTMMVMQQPERLKLLVWVMTLSIAFYGVKGGIFTITHGGVYQVRGPGNSFISGNNEIALALVMTVPLLRYLALSAPYAVLRFAMNVSMVLTALAAMGSHSRGALIGIAAMGAFLWLKSRNKIVTGLLGALAVYLVISIMPPAWFERMQTIQTYEQSDSALGRINAWYMAYNLARDKFLGGGFEAFKPAMFAAYAPEPWRVHDAHSIYFEVLGEHGFVGLALFLALGLMTWRSASWIIRRTRKDPQNRWAADLAAMVQVSLVGYAGAGAFLGLAYFDYYYTLVAVVIVCKVILQAQEAAPKLQPASEQASRPPILRPSPSPSPSAPGG